MNRQNIIEKLPYKKPFLFVDELLQIDENRVEGKYTFTKEEYFYKGHFKNNPVTPGVILTECMAQIGLVSLAIYLVDNKDNSSLNSLKIALTESHIEFLQPVYPETTVQVISEKVYFRFGKLKCNVKMIDSSAQVICKGTISGMMITHSHEEA